MRRHFFILFLLLELFFLQPAAAVEIQFDKLEIWSLDKAGNPLPMRLTLGQFANYLASHKAMTELFLPEENILELRVTDPVMNLHEHIANTYVFELDREANRALCNHFLLNGQERQGAELYANTTYLFQIVAGEGPEFSSNYKFHIVNADEPVPGKINRPHPRAEKKSAAEICGKPLLNMPLDSSLSMLLLEQENGARLYFYTDADCQLATPAICAKFQRKIRTPLQLKRFGVLTEEMLFINQCQPVKLQ